MLSCLYVFKGPNTAGLGNRVTSFPEEGKFELSPEDGSWISRDGRKEG